MFVYTYSCYLKTVQNILAIWRIWGKFISFSIQLESEKRFFTTFWHIFDNKNDLALRFRRTFSDD